MKESINGQHLKCPTMLYDCIVVGAGIIGSATAYQQAENRKKVLLIDQFGLPHTRGSSHGPTRIIKRISFDQLQTTLSLDAVPLWHKLERETGTQIIHETPLLTVEKLPSTKIDTVVRVMEESKQSYDISVVPLKEVTTRYKGLLKFDSGDYKCLVERKAGRIKADKALSCYWSQIKKFGGTIRDGEKVLDIIPGRIATVKTTKGTYSTRSVVITPGPWIAKLMKPLGLDLPVEAWRPTVCYWAEKVPGSYKDLPTFIDWSRKQLFVYAFRSDEYPGLIKLSTHNGPVVNPDHRDATYKESERDIGYLREYVKEHFPGIEPEPKIIDSCMYSITPDEEEIIGALPGYPNVVYAGGFSGHGFKIAPIIAQILTDMTDGKSPKYDISRLSISRFQSKSQSKL